MLPRHWFSLGPKGGSMTDETVGPDDTKSPSTDVPSLDIEVD